MIELRQPLPLETPRGRAWAHLILDYGTEHPLLFVCFLRDSGECWIFRQEDIRMEKNITMGTRAE